MTVTMLIAGAVILILLLYGAASDSSEKKAVKKSTALLPPNASITLNTSISGQSRRRAVTYFNHFVTAKCISSDGVQLEKQFPYQKHDKEEKSLAISQATSWAIVNSGESIKSPPRLINQSNNSSHFIERMFLPHAPTTAEKRRAEKMMAIWGNFVLSVIFLIFSFILYQFFS